MLNDQTDQVKLFMSLTQLEATTINSKFDPLIRVYSQDKGNWALQGETELLKDSSDFKFGIPVTVDFSFGLQQDLLFEVLNFGSNTAPELLGIARTTLAKIITAQKHFLLVDILDKETKEVGKLVIQRQKGGQGKRCISWQWAGKKLMNTDGLFDKSDPYLKFLKEKAPGEFVPVCETEIIMNNLNPVWKPFSVMANDITNGDDKPIKIECWDWEKKKKHQFIGDCIITLGKILSGQTEFELHNPKKKKKTGKLRLLSLNAREESSFLEYLLGGQPLKMFIGMNFSSPNGLPSYQNSSHFMNSDDSFNEFQNAMFGISQVLLDYDLDQTVPMYGFGGIPRFQMMNSGNVSNCFPCTGNPNQPRAMGLEGIMSTYSNALRNVDVGGSTNLAPMLKEVMQFTQIQKKIANGAYTILLVLTNSDTQDLQQTVNCLVEASQLPLSIMFVGIGDDSFINMEKLNNGKELVDAVGVKAQREVAHFVAFRNFKGDIEQFTQYVMDKVPDQFVEYMKIIGKRPNALFKADLSSIENSQKALFTRQTWSPALGHNASFVQGASDGMKMWKKMNTCCLTMTMPTHSNTSNLSSGSYELENNTQNASEMDINVQNMSVLEKTNNTCIPNEKETPNGFNIGTFTNNMPTHAIFARNPLAELKFGFGNTGSDSVSTEAKSIHPQIYPTFEDTDDVNIRV